MLRIVQDLNGHRRLSVALISAGFLAILPFVVLAAEGDAEGIAWPKMSMELLGGLAIFLFGMEQIAQALKVVAGERVRAILSKLTASRLMGLLTGAFVTAVIQSSSVTTVMLVGFVSAHLMSLSQAIGVILGADIGTTITAQIVAFKVTKYALLLVAVGFSFIFTSKSERIRQYGVLVMGLGMIFFGMAIMSDGMRPLRNYAPFIELMRNVSNPVVGIVAATAFTALIQSSSATMGVVIALALQGLITLEGGIALALGANIGTCATAALAAIGKPREAVRVAVAHVTFKTVGVLTIVWFIPAFADFIRYISPAADPNLAGMDKLAAETPRQIANAHTVFNVGIAFLFLPFSALFTRFCEWAVADRPLEEETIITPKYLDAELLDTPSLALERTRLEIGHMGERIKEMVGRMMSAVFRGSRNSLMTLAKIDDEVDILHGHIVTYLGRISGKTLTENQTKQLVRLMHAANDLENIGDIIETDLVALGEKRIEQGVAVSEETQAVLLKLHSEVEKAVDQAISAVVETDEQAAQHVIAMKGDINLLSSQAQEHQAQRLVAKEPGRLRAYALEIDLIEKLKRIYYFAKRMAKNVISEEAIDEAA